MCLNYKAFVIENITACISSVQYWDIDFFLQISKNVKGELLSISTYYLMYNYIADHSYLQIE